MVQLTCLMGRSLFVTEWLLVLGLLMIPSIDVQESKMNERSDR